MYRIILIRFDLVGVTKLGNTPSQSACFHVPEGFTDQALKNFIADQSKEKGIKSVTDFMPNGTECCKPDHHGFRDGVPTTAGLLTWH